MAYATTNPPFCLSQGVGASSKLWIYTSVDAATLVRVAGYFTNGYTLGMRAGDIVLQIDNDAAPIASQIMIVTTATATSVDLSDGVAITATNTD